MHKIRFHADLCWSYGVFAAEKKPSCSPLVLVLLCCLSVLAPPSRWLLPGLLLPPPILIPSVFHSLLDNSLIRRLKLTRRVLVLQGQSGLAGPAHTGRSFPKRSFMRPSWMEEDTVDSADTSESVFFSKVSRLLPAQEHLARLPKHRRSRSPRSPSFPVLWFSFSCLCLVFAQSVS